MSGRHARPHLLGFPKAESPIEARLRLIATRNVVDRINGHAPPSQAQIDAEIEEEYGRLVSEAEVTQLFQMTGEGGLRPPVQDDMSTARGVLIALGISTIPLGCVLFLAWLWLR